jgi:transposase-like protein
MAKKKKTSRYGFTPEIKAETLRLIREEGYTQKQAAEFAGCSINAINDWKKAAGKTKVAANGADTVEPAVKSVKKGKKTKRRRKGTTKAAVVATPVGKLSTTFDKFAQNYWSEHKGAMDIMRLPPDMMPKAVQYVNDVLQYAYGRLGGE